MGPSASDRIGKVGEPFSQLSLLTRHFFGRLFRNDIVDFEDQIKERLIALLSILAVFLGWISHLTAGKYLFGPDNNQSWHEKTYIFTLMMVLFGIVTVLEWEVLFPDRRDFLNLKPLPVGLRTLFCAKLTSLAMFAGLFSVAMSSISSLIFASYLSVWRSNSLSFAVRYVFAHLTSAFAACLFVFFVCIFVQVFLMTFLPFRIYKAISPYVRFVLIAVLVYFLLALLRQPLLPSGSPHWGVELKARSGPFAMPFPPLWFVGLYEVLVGTQNPVFGELAKTAGLSLLFSLIAFALGSWLSYRRYSMKTLETKKGGPPKLSWLRGLISENFQARVLRSPEERAVSGFFSKTIRSSVKHRMTLANYAGVAAGFIMLFVVVNQHDLGNLTPQNTALLAQSLMLSIVLLVGIRTLVNIPATPPANWVFQVTETVHRIRYVSGLKKTVFFKWCLPLSACVLLAHLMLWRDWRPAFEHAIFGLTLSGLGIEALFFRFTKIPFACTSVPGKWRLQTRAIPYLLGFFAIVAFLSYVEKELLKNPSKFAFYFALVSIIWTALRMGSNRFVKTHPMIYAEEPEPAMVSLVDEA